MWNLKKKSARHNKYISSKSALFNRGLNFQIECQIADIVAQDTGQIIIIIGRTIILVAAAVEVAMISQIDIMVNRVHTKDPNALNITDRTAIEVEAAAVAAAHMAAAHMAAMTITIFVR